MTREPEWDDQQRNLMLALAEVEGESCPDCGHHPVITDDPSNVFMPTTRVCSSCKGTDQYLRIQAAADEAAEANISKDAPPQTPRPSDGRKTYLRPLSPTEIAEAKAKGGEQVGNTSRARRSRTRG